MDGPFALRELDVAPSGDNHVDLDVCSACGLLGGIIVLAESGAVLKDDLS